MTEPSRPQAEVDARLRRALEIVPEPRLSRDFPARLARRLRAEPLPTLRVVRVSTNLSSRRRWILRAYWVAATIVVAATIDLPALEPMRVQSLGAAAGVVALMLRQIMHPWSLRRVMRDALR